MSDLTKRLGALSPEQRRLLELELSRKGVSIPVMPSVSADGGGWKRSPPSESGARAGERGRACEMRFSLFFFSDDGSTTSAEKYRLLLESARYVDEQGFAAVWTPERHFQDFGGLYPNPSILAAALAMITKRVRLRSGSVVLPLHNPIRVAEEWSVVDNLSAGRVELAFASGWHPGDFVLSPENFADRKEVMFQSIELVRKLWAGERVGFRAPQETDIDLRILPRPIQEHLPIWLTSSGNPQTWKRAGEIGAHVLTAMQGETVETLKKKIDQYRESLAAHGHEPESGQVAVMLHTYLGRDLDAVKETVRPAMTAYMQTFLKESENSARRSISTHVKEHSDQDNELRAQLAFEYYFNKNSLLGTADKCAELIEGLSRIGVSEIACLIDFGLDVDVVLEGLRHLNELRMIYAPAREAQSQLALTPA
jgi:natural product biosynthesis luciferase-like monooxygenase protein